MNEEKFNGESKRIENCCNEIAIATAGVETNNVGSTGNSAVPSSLAMRYDKCNDALIETINYISIF